MGLGSHRPLSGQLYKYTNVVKGWQQRWFAVDPETGVLSYYLFDGPGDTVQPGQPARGEVSKNSRLYSPIQLLRQIRGNKSVNHLANYKLSVMFLNNNQVVVTLV